MIIGFISFMILLKIDPELTDTPENLHQTTNYKVLKEFNFQAIISLIKANFILIYKILSKRRRILSSFKILEFINFKTKEIR